MWGSTLGGLTNGVRRIPQYVDEIQRDEIKTGVSFEIVWETAASALVEGHQGWGMATTGKAMQLAIEKARPATIGLVLVRGSPRTNAVAILKGRLRLSTLYILL